MRTSRPTQAAQLSVVRTGMTTNPPSKSNLSQSIRVPDGLALKICPTFRQSVVVLLKPLIWIYHPQLAKHALLQGKTRWKPRTRMYSHSRSWTTSENLCNRKTNLFFHASCVHIVSAKAPDQQFTKRQLTHKDTHGKHRLKTVHISPVTSLQCGMESVECGV